MGNEELERIRRRLLTVEKIIAEKDKQIHTIENERVQYYKERNDLNIELSRKTVKTEASIEALLKKMGFEYIKKNVYINYISLNLEYQILLNYNFDGNIISFMVEQRYNKMFTSHDHFNIYNLTLEEIGTNFGNYILKLIKGVD